MHGTGHDADLAGTGRDDARTVRSDQHGLRLAQHGLDLQHVKHRDTLGDAHNQPDAGGGGLEDRIGGKRGRHVDHGGISAGGEHGLAHGVEHRQPEVGLASLAGRDAADQLRAVFQRLL